MVCSQDLPTQRRGGLLRRRSCQTPTVVQRSTTYTVTATAAVVSPHDFVSASLLDDSNASLVRRPSDY